MHHSTDLTAVPHIIHAALKRPRQGSYRRASISAWHVSSSLDVASWTTHHELDDAKAAVRRI